MNEEIKDFLTIKEFAAKLRIHPNTVRNSIRSGRLNAFRIGHGARASYRISASEINRIALFDLEHMVNKIVEMKIKEREKEIK